MIIICLFNTGFNYLHFLIYCPQNLETGAINFIYCVKRNIIIKVVICDTKLLKISMLYYFKDMNILKKNKFDNNFNMYVKLVNTKSLL